jgi:hypothetical protein
VSRAVTLAVSVLVADGASVREVAAGMRGACERMAAGGVIEACAPQVTVLRRDARRDWRTAGGLAHELLRLPLDAAVELSVSAGGQRARRGLRGVSTDYAGIHPSGIVVLGDFDVR